MSDSDARRRFNCPICGYELTRPAASVGKRERCPKCGEPFIIPKGTPVDDAAGGQGQ